MQTPAQSAAHEHAAHVADVELITNCVMEGATEACDGQVHVTQLAVTRYEDGSPPYLYFVVQRDGMDRYYKVFALVMASDVAPSISVATSDPRHQHGGA